MAPDCTRPAGGPPEASPLPHAPWLQGLGPQQQPLRPPEHSPQTWGAGLYATGCGAQASPEESLPVTQADQGWQPAPASLSEPSLPLHAPWMQATSEQHALLHQTPLQQDHLWSGSSSAAAAHRPQSCGHGQSDPGTKGAKKIRFPGKVAFVAPMEYYPG